MADISRVRDWVWYGGRPSIDFVNTRRDRYSEGRELLEKPEDLASWMTIAGLVPTPVEVTRALLGEAIDLREAIDAGIAAIIDHRNFPRASADLINQWLIQHPTRLELDSGIPTLREPSFPEDARSILSQVARDAADVLGTDQRERLGICAGVGCSGRFFDNSAIRKRRWCQMSVCGNRAKTERFRRNPRTADLS